MTTCRQTKEHLAKHKLAPKKKFGQNFLVNGQTAERIVNLGQFSPDDIVIEIGVGLGALTRPLASKVHRVIGIEIDRGIIRFHQKEQDLPHNVQLVHKDVLKTDFAELYQLSQERKIKLIANLPYSISNPFIFKLIENKHLLDCATIMLQKEVAERLTAPSDTKEYGIPTILLNACATPTKLLTLKPGEFHPRPKIDSQVIRIDFNLPQLNIAPSQEKFFTSMVRKAFAGRRKTLVNNFCSGNWFDPKLTKPEKKKIIIELLQKTGVSVNTRAETLGLDDFKRLSEIFFEYFFETVVE